MLLHHPHDSGGVLYPSYNSGEVLWHHVCCNNFSKYKWIFTPNLVCALIFFEIWLGIANGQISSISDSDTSEFSLLDNNFSKYQWIFTILSMCIDSMCIDIVVIWFGIATGHISLIF